MRNRALAATAVLLTFGVGLTGLTIAHAASGTRDCVLDTPSGAERCFDNYRDAMSFATNGAVTDAPLSAHDAAVDPNFQNRVTMLSARRAVSTDAVGSETTDRSVIGATLFTGTGFTGDSEILRIPRPCVKDGLYDFAFKLGTIGRNTASIQVWANCWAWLHSGDTVDSPRQGPYKGDTSDLGDWKRRAVLLALS
jgi:hypothetical protein